MDSPLQWFEAIWYPTRPLLDPRPRPGHLSLLLALHRLAAVDRSGVREWYEFGDDGHAVPLVEGQVLRHARFGNEALPRYRVELQRWGYLRYRHHPGHPSLYDIVTIDDDIDTESFFPIPVMVCDDFTLKPGHLAAYLALAHAAEQRRIDGFPANADDFELWEFAAYGYRCDVRGRDLDRAAGFRHSTTRNRYLAELVHAGHVTVEQKGRQQKPTRYRLLSNQAADKAQRAAYQRRHEQWAQQRMSGELGHQAEGAT